MSSPVCCFTCGKIFTAKLIKLIREENPNYAKIFKDFGIKRYCCSTILMTISTTIEEIANQNS